MMYAQQYNYKGLLAPLANGGGAAPVVTNRATGGAVVVPKQIIIAGGGTGGHIFPAIAIANAIKRIDSEIKILFVGATGKMEMEKVPQAGFDIKGITIAGFNRNALHKNLSLPLKLLLSFFQVKSIFKAFRPNAVIGVGGYSTFPVLKYAQSKGIPTYIHESNSFAGKSNILLGKNATTVFVATKGMESFFPAKKLMVSGNPVRAAIANSILTKKEATSFFGLREDAKTILVIGGSLGAKSINDAITNILADIEANDWQLIWQTGKVHANVYQSHAKGKKNIWIGEFINQMEMAYTAADVVVSRAGAMAIAELCAVAKPAILIPYPYAADDHQTFNAQTLVKHEAAFLIPEKDLSTKLLKQLTHFFNDDALVNRYSQNIHQLYYKNADTLIAKTIIEQCFTGK